MNHALNSRCLSRFKQVLCSLYNPASNTQAAMNDNFGVSHCLAERRLIEQTALAKLYGKPPDAGGVLGSMNQRANVPCA